MTGPIRHHYRCAYNQSTRLTGWLTLRRKMKRDQVDNDQLLLASIDKAIVVRLGKKRLLRATIRHAEVLRGAEEAASETEEIAKKHGREETKSAGGSGKSEAVKKKCSV